MDLFDHALSIADHLAKVLGDFEVSCANAFARPSPEQERIIVSIKKIWPSLVADARRSEVSPDIDYVSRLYDRLAEFASVTDPGQFTDRDDIPWEVFYRDACGDDAFCEGAWIIAELFWGNYVKFFQISLSWLLMDAIRIQNGLIAIVPCVDSEDRFIRALRAAGPDTFDAEDLRALLFDYGKEIAAD